MKRPGIAPIMFGCLIEFVSTSAMGQGVSPVNQPSRVYGTSWGVASYGLKQTSSVYSSPFGVGYGYGIPPLGFVPGKFGVELWRPNEVVSTGIYGVPNRYRTFPYPYPVGPPAYGPSIGSYAPGFGPELRSPSVW